MIDKVLVIGAGKWQVPLIEFLRYKARIVDAIDPHTDAVGSALVDEHILLDIKESDSIYEVVKDRQYNLVISDQSDLGIETATLLSERLGLPGNQIQATCLFLKKHLSRQYAKDQGIRIPEFCSSSDIVELEQFAKSLNRPFIVKPSDAQASRGITKIDSFEKERVLEAIRSAKASGRNDIVLIEEFIIGTELTVEGICLNGTHKTLAISDKKHFRTGIASDLRYPAEIPDAITDELIRLNDKYVNNSGLCNAITHAEYIYDRTNGNLYLVEIACRGGGTLISSDIVPWLTGVNIYDLLFNSLMGARIELPTPAQNNAALLHFFEFPDGLVKSIEGLDKISLMPGVHRVHLEITEGQIIRKAIDDSKRHGYVILFERDIAGIEKSLQEVYKTIKVKMD